MHKIPVPDMPRWFEKPKQMYCAYAEWCKIDCGHKKIHKENTACHNMCVVYGVITCYEVKKTWRERWQECKQHLKVWR